MSVPTLFIGVVSHEGSRFAVSQGPGGLAHRIAAAMPGVAVQVNTSDLLDPGSPLPTADAVQASLSAEADLEAAWARYLERPRTAQYWAFRASRRARLAAQRWRPPSPAMLRRLLNIELSHLDLMRRGLDSGAPWVLILEDDGFADDLSDLVEGLEGLMGGSAGYVNLSASFSPRELGIEHLLAPASVGWQGSHPRAALTVDRPVTNTVCAVLYSTAFLALLVSAMDRLSIEPVVPIDWKLNMALMDLHAEGMTSPDTCLLVEPAPIAQMSMRPAEILPS